MDTSTRSLLLELKTIFDRIECYSEDKTFLLSVVSLGHQKFTDWEEMQRLGLVFVFEDRKGLARAGEEAGSATSRAVLPLYCRWFGSEIGHEIASD